VCFLALTPAGLLAADGVVANVNGIVIRKSQLDSAIHQLVVQGQQDTPELRGRLKDELIARELIVQEAVKAGVDKRDEVREQLDLATSNLLVNSYLQTWSNAHPVKDADIQSEYDRLKVDLAKIDEFQVRHILIKDERVAKSVLAEVKEGKSFDKLASTVSEDVGTKAKGGDLGWVRSDAKLAAPFLQAMMKLKRGETSGLIKTEFGYHIIRIEDVRKAQAPAIDQVRGELTQFMQRRAIEKMVQDLRSRAVVELLDVKDGFATTKSKTAENQKEESHPPDRPKPDPVKSPKMVNQKSEPSSVIEKAKSDCMNLGFKKGTEKFGKCVLDLTK